MATRRRRNSAQVTFVLGELDKFVELIVIALALEFASIMKSAPGQGGTPIDTAWARANWVVRIGEDRSGVNATPKSREARAQMVSQAAGAQAASEAVFATSYKLESGDVVVGNPAPYLPRLNAGSSTQAPAMFVEAGIDQAIRNVVRQFAATGGGR